MEKICPKFSIGHGLTNQLKIRGNRLPSSLPDDFINNEGFDVTLNRKTIRGSIIGTRQDLTESLVFTAAGKVKVHYHTERLENINQVFADLKAG